MKYMEGEKKNWLKGRQKMKILPSALSEENLNVFLKK